MPEYSNKKYNLTELYTLIEEQLACGGSVSFTVNGSSMRPMLFGGRDSVKITTPVLPLKKYDIPLYKRAGGQFVLHRIIKVSPRGYVCRGDNQLIKEFPVTDNMIIGVVSKYTHNGKTRKVNSAGHKIYAFLYTHTAYIRCCARNLFLKLRRR